MGRRSRNDFELIVQLAIGLILLTIIFPPLRQKLSLVAIVAMAVLGTFGIGVLIFRFVRQHAKSQPAYRSYDLQSLELLREPGPVSVPTHSGAEVSTPMPVAPMSLVDQLHSLDWFQFEKLVAMVYAKLDYHVKRRGGANPDGGIDLVLEKDGARIGVQCKDWKRRDVGVQALREFLGALADAGLKQGKFIALGDYTDEAKQFAERRGIEAVNQDGLIALLKTTNSSLDPKVLAFLTDTTKYLPPVRAGNDSQDRGQGAERRRKILGLLRLSPLQFHDAFFVSGTPFTLFPRNSAS